MLSLPLSASVNVNAPPHTLKDSNVNSKVKTTKARIGGMFPSLQHFESRGACCSSGMGTKTNDKWVNYSHEHTHPKQ